MPKEEKAPGKKTHQIGVKLESELYERLLDACKFQEHREGQLGRILVEWALPYYEQAHSVENLKNARVQIEKSPTLTTPKTIKGGNVGR